MKRFRALTFCAAILAGMFVFLSSSWAQQQDMSKGTIQGVVKDPSGAVVTGATITLSTPQGDRSSTTGGEGSYSFGGLTPGPGYSVTAEKAGFSKAKLSNLSVTTNSTATADFSLQVGATATTVDVVGSSGTQIDLQSTSVGATLDESLYKNVAVGRNISSIINMAPGVADSAGAGSANPSINGASGLENQYNIDGSDVTDPGFGGFGTYSRVMGPLGNGVNFDFVEQVQVKTGGFEAQYGEALGGVINVQTKSGTNTYHGGVYGFFQPIAFEAARINPNPALVNKVTFVQNQGKIDYGFNLGGYLKKNKIFFFVGFNPTQATTAEIADPSFSNYSLGTQYLKPLTYNYVAKLTWNITGRHTIDASVYGDPAHSPTGFQTGVNTVQPPLGPETTSESALDYGSRTWSVHYNGTLSSHWVVTANFSDHQNNFTETPLQAGYQIEDVTQSQAHTGPTVTYGGIGYLENFVSKSRQVNVGSSHVFNLLGAHSLDYGFQYENQPYTDILDYSGGDFTLPNVTALGAAAGQTVHGGFFVREHESSSNLSSPIVLVLDRGNYSSPNINVGSSYSSGYVQDAWSVNRHLTLKIGLRFEQQDMFGTYLKYVFGHNWAPRIGYIYDPTGSRKSKIYVNWGRFYEKIPQDISIRAFSFETSVIGPSYADPGVGAQPNLAASNYIPGAHSIAFSGSPDDVELIAGGTGAQYQDEFVVGYDREFDNGLTFSSRFIRRDLKRVLEDMSGINVTQYNAGVPQQYVVGNPSAKLDIFQNAYPCTGGLPKCDPSTGFTPVTCTLCSDGIPDGFPDPVRIYKGVDITLGKRFGKGYQVYANYTVSSLTGNYQGNFRSDNGQTDPNISSMFDFTNTDGLLSGQYEVGPLETDRRNQLKLFGNKSFKAINFGLSWNIESGTPITKLLDHPAYDNAGEVPDGPRGAYGRTPWQFPINFHVDYTYKINERMHAVLIADLFNVFDQRAVNFYQQWAEINNAPGVVNPDFLKPTSQSGISAYQLPFNARLGVRFEF